MKPGEKLKGVFLVSVMLQEKLFVKFVMSFICLSARDVWNVKPEEYKLKYVGAGNVFVWTGIHSSKIYAKLFVYGPR